MADIWRLCLESIWLFLPIGIANLMPTLVYRLPLLNWPIDGDRLWHGKMIFGPHKTWRGFFFGAVGAQLFFLLQRHLFFSSAGIADISLIDYGTAPILTGAVMGFGALLGDAIRAFFKRRVSIAPGAPWIPFDQIDYLLGGILFTRVMVDIPWHTMGLALVLGFPLHLIVNYVGWLILPYKNNKW